MLYNLIARPGSAGYPRQITASGRVLLGGEMSTSKLQRRLGDMLDKKFPQYRIRENYRPDWLVSSDRSILELDFYIEELKIAFEVQGAQHYQFIPFFHSDHAGFEKRLKYDREKQDLCYGRGVRLIEISTETDAIIAVKNIEEAIAKDNYPVYIYERSPQELEETRLEAERRQQKKERKLAFAKEMNKNGNANKRISPPVKPHSKEELLKEFQTWQIASIRRYKKGVSLDFEYIPHFGILRDDIKHEISSGLPLCNSLDDIRRLFDSVLQAYW